jgi:hypothetical protein
MVAEYQPFYLGRGMEELAEAYRNRRRGVARDEQFLAGIRGGALGSSGAEAVSRWIKYRAMTAGRLLNRNLGAALLQKRLEAGVATNAVGPYEFSPDVIARVRARILSEPKEAR